MSNKLLRYILKISFITFAFATSAVADETRQCTGILTSNGVCIGSESNVPPPVVYCEPNSSDPRCIRSRR